MKEKLRFETKGKKEIFDLIDSRKRVIFNFLNAYSVYLFRYHKNFKEKIYNKQNFNFPDGFTVSIVLSLKNLKMISRTQGPEFTLSLLSDQKKCKNKKQLFIGMSESDKKYILNNFPHLKNEEISCYPLPFIKKQKYVDKKLLSIIGKTKPDFIWIGIGNPKQEILANDLYEEVNYGKIFNVGAAFDYIRKKKKQAPKIWQKLGFEWFYRLITDFRHTWKKVIGSLIGFFISFYTIKSR
ncbi:MAG: WecB/TagA/CpsF family glycosyltransferase [Nanoarchaeota archaeon]